MTFQCASGRQCLWWVEKFLGDCVCGVLDYVSVGFGLISLFSWAVAEVPQIVTNFRNGSTEGVSLGFLMTWVMGDLFNLIGCWLEPETLPTQLYTALLYTITTIVLVFQIICYDHVSNWWKARKTGALSKIKPKVVSIFDRNDKTKTEPVNIDNSYVTATKAIAIGDSNKSYNRTTVSSLPIPTASTKQAPHTESQMFYRSARSLASSKSPTPGSYVLHSRGSASSGPSYILNQSSLDKDGLLVNLISPSPKKSKIIMRSVASTLFFVSWMNCLNFHTDNIAHEYYSKQAQETYGIIRTGRKVLQQVNGGVFGNSMLKDEPSSPVATCLGWLMAAIYMGGRLPQIRLNGLNPLMFIFALVGNGTYVGSILIRTLEWQKLKPNLPWLIDAAICVLLDAFVSFEKIVLFIIRPKELTSTKINTMMKIMKHPINEVKMYYP